MSKLLVIVVVVVVAVGGLWWYTSHNSANPMTSNAPMVGGKGRVVFAVTDAATSLQNIESVNMTVNKVEVESATKGWVTVSDKTQVFDLLKLKASGALALLADVKLDAGTYNQIRLNVTNVTVVQAGKSNTAKLPSGSLKIVGNLVVDSNNTSAATLDFMVDKSLHLTGTGLFIFAPVVRLTTQSKANATVESDNTVKIDGGKVDTDEEVGMNEKGETGEDMEIDADADVEINVDGSLHVMTKSDLGPVTVKLSAQNNSGISGTATLTEVDGKAQVKLALTGGLATLAEPAHIHLGSCAALGDVKYPLSNVLTGKSTTVLNVSLAQLKAGLPLAINVHKSVAEAGVYVACGDIKF